MDQSSSPESWEGELENALGLTYFEAKQTLSDRSRVTSDKTRVYKKYMTFFDCTEKKSTSTKGRLQYLVFLYFHGSFQCTLQNEVDCLM
jgi:hypothetical protein